ncbi:MAG: tetratricopeptide repeat protein [Candidatus Brocadiia bacterium]
MRRILIVLALLALVGAPVRAGTEPPGLAPRTSPGGSPAQRAATAPTPQDSEKAGRVFRRVWTEEMPPDEKVRLLESIVKDHPRSEWADDALWALGEAARQEGLPARMMHYWHYLLSARPDVRLEDYTRSLPIYLRSGLPQVEMLLLAEGQSMVPRRRDVVNTEEANLFLMRNARRFNPVPMTVWGELAECYRKRGRLSLALKAYRKALEAAPESGRLRERCRQKMRETEAQVNAARSSEPRPSVAAGRSGIPGSEAHTAEEDPADTGPEASGAHRVEVVP